MLQLSNHHPVGIAIHDSGSMIGRAEEDHLLMDCQSAMREQIDMVNCPTCGASETRPMSRLDYCPGSPLPETVGLYGCAECDSGFTMPRDARRYDAYYREMQNDETITSAGDLVVYGFGDNFHRARSAQGLLEGASIKAIVDRRWEELSREFGDQYRFMSVDDAVLEYADLPFVVTVSWGGEEIATSISSRIRANVFVL